MKVDSLEKDAMKFLPGGVNSPVRAFKAVGGRDFFVSRAAGAKIYDISGKKYIDYVMSWGAAILGHAQPVIVKSVKKVIEKGTSFGFTSPLEVKLAKMICGAIPSVEMIRFTNSGTEAVMSALRLARAYTGRNKILKFSGCYHGHCDAMLCDAGSGQATFGIPSSPGVTEETAANTIVCEFNNTPALKKALKKESGKIAAVIVEPIAANMGVVAPDAGFLEEMRRLTRKYGILLIFDEVITGFRLTYGGYQNLIGLKPDLTVLGKIIGGGFPVGAFGGRRAIMRLISPSGPVYQAGTLSGNPVAMRAGLSALKILKRENMYAEIEEKAEFLANEIKTVKSAVTVNRAGSMFTVFFAKEKVGNYAGAEKSSAKNFAEFFGKILERGILFPPSRFEACFISGAHTWNDLKKTAEVLKKSIQEVI